MPRGRPPLDPDVKQQHREEALKRYSDKNANKLREAARLRMQWHRAAIANSDIFTQRRYAGKAALSSERYRDRKRDEERAERHATDAVTRQARGIEKDALHRKHASTKKALQAKPLALPPLAKPPPHAPMPPCTVPKPCAVSPITPTPAPCRTAVICIASTTLPSRRYGQHVPPAPSVALTATRRTA
ncbi:hypothetical protein B0H14DRAFT_3531566 [Mycena olivaceomarginata]|nr:hypothetical protein B0H14DRAFT_3531566 [Mycena olivaceomarginata]